MAKSVVEITECYSESEMRDKKTKVLIVIICGIIVHMICFSSIADIYFRSTVVHGMMLYSCSLEAPARRVVFIVSDGLRADNFFEANNSEEGHSPYLRKMSENIRLIDDNIKKLVEIIENIFQNDHKTAYFFTSDHGMTSDGHHAEGSKNETQVPLVAWGAGIHKPRQNKGAENSSPSSWLLSDIARLDTESITIAPLLASLMGIPIPVNSMGVLPHDFLDVSEHHLSCMMISNTLQIYANFRRKSELAGRGILLQKFPLLDHENALQLMSKVHALKNGGKHNESVRIIYSS
ncbi:hypothetical protein C0J52_21235 [Blattella germanica]|nr:hypothetical protein C0J52_21235 [Blattella germanica]